MSFLIFKEYMRYVTVGKDNSLTLECPYKNTTLSWTELEKMPLMAGVSVFHRLENRPIRVREEFGNAVRDVYYLGIRLDGVESVLRDESCFEIEPGKGCSGTIVERSAFPGSTKVELRETEISYVLGALIGWRVQHDIAERLITRMKSGVSPEYLDANKLSVKKTVTTRQKALPGEQDKENKDKILELIQNSGFSYVDKRLSGGSLWIIAGEKEGKRLADQCKELGVTFIFTSKGGRASKHMPAWYSK